MKGEDQQNLYEGAEVADEHVRIGRCDRSETPIEVGTFTKLSFRWEPFGFRLYVPGRGRWRTFSGEAVE